MILRAELVSYFFVLTILAAPAIQAQDRFDPFANIVVNPVSPAVVGSKPEQNLLFRREIGTQLTTTFTGVDRDLFSRSYGGFEILKRFATDSKTIASLNLQANLNYRYHYLKTMSDDMIADVGYTGWDLHIHNAYADFYNILGRAGEVNLRVGRFYIPFGLNGQTDTHATFMQLTNGRNFGYNRDLMVGGYGALNDHLNYDLAYTLGDGMDSSHKGQTGLLVTRLSLANQWNYERGLEGGVSAAYGERRSEHAVMLSQSVAESADEGAVVDTWRLGLDARLKVPATSGVITITTESSVGADERDDVASSMLQFGWLSSNRVWGTDLAIFEYWQNRKQEAHHTMNSQNSAASNHDTTGVFNVTYYLDNDVSGSKLQWLSFGVERHLKRMIDEEYRTVYTVQYYRYW